MDKPALRRESFHRLKSIPLEERERRSGEIRERIAKLPAFEEAEVVCCYLALASEPDLAELAIRFPEKTWGIPRVDPVSERIRFHLLPDPASLVRSEHGILEPAASTPILSRPPHLVLVPGVAFDPASGTRLGRGKGHYDRCLAPLKLGLHPPFLVGTCFREQLLPLAAEAHDVPMDSIVSA